MTELIEKD